MRIRQDAFDTPNLPVKIKLRDWLMEFNFNFKRPSKTLNHKTLIEFVSKTPAYQKCTHLMQNVDRILGSVIIGVNKPRGAF